MARESEKVNVPKSLRAELKHELHLSHQYIKANLRRARECIFWPGMTTEIEDLIAMCHVSQKHVTKKQSESPL